MPELPEVETSRRGIAPALTGQIVRQLMVRQPRLRWPVPPSLAQELPGHRILTVERRAKYLLLPTSAGKTLIIHLGMSGHLRLMSSAQAYGPHDHLELQLDTGLLLRYTDPRRFGAWLWETEPLRHPLLAQLGPEPLSETFTATYLQPLLQKRRQAIKLALMDQQLVVGVGNIYANEALFLARLDPRRPAASLGLSETERLVTAVKQLLAAAIEQGGTTLRDFYSSTGRPGYFALSLAVYGREGQRCQQCQAPLQSLRLGQRATVYCPQCQQ